MVVNSGKFDWAIWDPITDRSTQANTVDRMTLHTAVTSAPDIYGPGKGPSGTYAHFYNPLSARIRQHQEIHHKAYADLDANGRTVAVEHQDNAHEMPFSESQLDDDARLFAHLVTHYGTPNRIATVDNTKGLAWHRLGVDGNFGAYNSHDRTTWCKKQTGQNWSNATGKLCPYDTRILQVDQIYSRAQQYITGDNSGSATTGGGDDDMALKHVVRSRATNQNLANKDDWQTIKVREDNDAPAKQLTLGPADIISGTVYLHATGLGNDGKIEARLYAVDDPDDSSKEPIRASTGSIIAMFAPKGGVRDALPFTWRLLGSGKTGVKRRLQLEVRAKADTAVIDGVRTEMWIQDK